jgi:hypothetical protein
MPKSRLRGGKKSHRKRVQKRNQNIQSQQNRIQKLWEEEMIKRMEELKTSGETTINEEVTTEQPLDIKL